MMAVVSSVGCVISLNPVLPDAKLATKVEGSSLGAIIDGGMNESFAGNSSRGDVLQERLQALRDR